ncbi:MAG: hypothetical protein OXG37_06700 [Actinomycetia bacterium]|nr:hypothetical protein [Actinomycetes bacterium]
MNDELVDRPLQVGEVIAETIRIYGRRAFVYFAIGAIWALPSFLLTQTTPGAADVVIVGVAFVVGLLVTIPLVLRLSLKAWLRRVAGSAVMLVPLVAVVGVPAGLAALEPWTAAAASVWLALAVFALPVVLLEEAPEGTSTLRYLLTRCVKLGRVGYVHALMTVLVLLLVPHLVGLLMRLALVAYADNTQATSLLIVQAVLMPFVFIGLTVLYCEQSARLQEPVRSAFSCEPHARA